MRFRCIGALGVVASGGANTKPISRVARCCTSPSGLGRLLEPGLRLEFWALNQLNLEKKAVMPDGPFRKLFQATQCNFTQFDPE